jgi:hypothetical protein
LDLSVEDLRNAAHEGATFAECPAGADNAKAYARWEKDYKRWLRQNENIRASSAHAFRMRQAKSVMRQLPRFASVMQPRQRRSRIA